MDAQLCDWTVTVTLPGCPSAPAVPAELTQALERSAAARAASRVVSAWSAARTVVGMTVRAPGPAAAKGIGLDVVAEACGAAFEVEEASVTAEPASPAACAPLEAGRTILFP
jgi:metal-sulfur cluster biosynthetic enzyme